MKLACGSACNAQVLMRPGPLYKVGLNVAWAPPPAASCDVSERLDSKQVCGSDADADCQHGHCAAASICLAPANENRVYDTVMGCWIAQYTMEQPESLYCNFSIQLALMGLLA